MRRAIVYLSALGIAGGAVFVLSPWVFGIPGPSLGFVIAPALMGAAMALTHWCNLKRVRRASGHSSFVGALAANGTLLFFFILGGMWLYERDSALPRFPIVAALFTLLCIVPCAANAIYVVAARNRD